MSYLEPSLLPAGPSALHDRAGGAGGADKTKHLRRSQSHAGLLAPLRRWARDPTGSLGELRETLLGAGCGESRREAQAREERRQGLYLRMRQATTYDDWRASAAELDRVEGNDVWKAQDDSHEYNVALVAARLQELDAARINGDATRMLFLVRTALTRDLGGMGDARLYRHSHLGTKALIERYIASAKETIEALLAVSAARSNPAIEPRHLLAQLLEARQAFGRSALLLSGGGTFGMSHIGVVKSLWERNLLPRIVSGSSAGSIVCAVLCTKTDAEMPEILNDFCYGDLNVFLNEQEEGLLQVAARFLKHGTVFDVSNLTRVMRNLLGDITFQEAYNRTRRILNINVSSESLYELPRLLNYVTAPNVIIWSAVAASCSVPIVFSAATLLAKDPKTGEQVEWNPSPHRWIDGSVDSDLPMTRVAEMFNVNHFIVSQVNPHVVPFLVRDDLAAGQPASGRVRGSTGPGWLQSMANLAKGEAMHRMHVLAELGVFPTTFTKLRSVLAQRYSGDITILPEISYAQFPRVLQNPTPEFMLDATLSGARATWSKLSMIQNHVAVELALDDAVRRLRARVVFSPSQVDLRINNLAVGAPSGGRRSVDQGRRTRHLRSARSLDPRAHGHPNLQSFAAAVAAAAADYSEYSESSDASHARRVESVRPRGTLDGPGVLSTDFASSSMEDDPEREGASSAPATSPSSSSSSDEALSDDGQGFPSPLSIAWPSSRRLFARTSLPTTPYAPSSPKSP